MTWIRDFVRLTADQPPLWIAAIVAVGAICAVLVLVGGAVIATAGLTWLRSALDPDGVQRVRVDSPEAHAIEARERIAAGKCPAGPIVQMTGERR
jgi:hypothetical protein